MVLERFPKTSLNPLLPNTNENEIFNSSGFVLLYFTIQLNDEDKTLAECCPGIEHGAKLCAIPIALQEEIDEPEQVGQDIKGASDANSVVQNKIQSNARDKVKVTLQLPHKNKKNKKVEVERYIDPTNTVADFLKSIEASIPLKMRNNLQLIYNSEVLKKIVYLQIATL